MKSKSRAARPKVALEGLARRAPVEWDKVDWTLTDADLSRKYGVSRQAVGKARERRKIMPAPKRRVVRLPQKQRLARALELCGKLVAWDRVGMWDYLPAWAAEEWNKTVDEAKALLAPPSDQHQATASTEL
jgi:hypothetical protein